jgi:class 3 adenylate cyclase
MRCSNCNADNQPAAKFCIDCGAAFSLGCAKCSFENPPNAKFCQECGTPFKPGAQSPQVPNQPSPTRPEITIANEAVSLTPDTIPDGERKTITALFADIKGSTELMRNLDPEEARAIVDPILRLMIEAVHRYGGYVAKSTGDGIFAMFGAPVAHEDHPQRALHAAIAIQQGLRKHDEGVNNQARARVEARIGVNTGEVVLRLVHTGGHTEYTPVGHAANLAARMESAAPAGGIVISEETQHLVAGYFELRGLGPTEVKGIEKPINIYEVIDAGPLRGHFELALRRGLTKFVGREHEIAGIKRTLELTLRGNGQIVAMVGEASTGKSRLVYEFKVTIPAECKLLEAYSVSHGNASPWLPVLELLRSYFGLKDIDDAVSRREKVRNSLVVLDPSLADALPYLWNLLAIQEQPDPLAQMDAQIKHQRTLDAIKRIILRESLNQPVVIIFEDLHWIDAQTQALLDLLADSIADARVLMLVNYRPAYRHQWSKNSNYSQLQLETLSSEAAREMLTTLLGANAELEPLKRMIIERTQGNPFFMEEMLQALFDEGALVRNGAVKVTRPPAQVRLPQTVQGILAARIDRQPAEHKQLLQTLAVMGREAPLGLIKQLIPPGEARLREMLAELQASEFIYEQPALPDPEYVFKHALTQEVAYNSMLIERRKVLHELAGQALELIFAENLDDHLAELARHYSHSDNVEKAIEYLERAGQQGIQHSANTDAAGNLTAAIGLLRKLPHSPQRIRRELGLQLSLAAGLSAIKGFAAPEVERTVTRARELAEQQATVRNSSMRCMACGACFSFERNFARPTSLPNSSWRARRVRMTQPFCC